MDKLSLHAIYELAFLLHPLTTLKDANTKVDLFIDTWQVIPKLQGLLQGNPLTLRNKAPVNALIQSIQAATAVDKDGTRDKGWAETEVTSFTVQQISKLASNLEIILANEFPLFHSYLISEKGILSIDALINNPERIFNKRMITQMHTIAGNPLADFKESARCLAFGFATACGFHVVRSAEAVLRKWHQLINPSANPKTEWAP